MIQFDISVSGAPQVKGSKWTAKVKGSTQPAFLVGATVSFKDGDGQHRGLYQPSLSQLPKLYYDRQTAAASIGLWAHFMWPTVTAEGGGHHLVLNTYDRARFTFGFYQLAAHTPKDNLILLFRALLKLPKAADYFPDLHLVDGKVSRTDAGTTYSLETETQVHRPNGKVETQLVAFMSYLNPDTTTAGEAEVLNGAKLMHWLLNDPLAVDASVAVASGIMRRKVKAAASQHGLTVQGSPAGHLGVRHHPPGPGRRQDPRRPGQTHPGGAADRPVGHRLRPVSGALHDRRGQDRPVAHRGGVQGRHPRRRQAAAGVGGGIQLRAQDLSLPPDRPARPRPEHPGKQRGELVRHGQGCANEVKD
jgi:hypothetical protein